VFLLAVAKECKQRLFLQQRAFLEISLRSGSVMGFRWRPHEGARVFGCPAGV